MAFGDGPHDGELLDAWFEFCEQLRRAADAVFKDANPTSSIQRADGFRFLTQNLGQAFDLALESRDTSYPAFHPFVTPTRKLGSDCADGVYLQAWIDGTSTYRISGQRGTARFWNLAIQGARPATGTLHEPFGDRPEVNVLGTELATEADGTFELYLGGEQREPNWLPTTPESRKVFFRQFFDRWDEEPARVTIERVGMEGPPPPPDHIRLVEAMGWAGTFVREAMEQWPDFLWQTPALCDAASVNQFAGRNLRQPLGPEDVRRGRFLTQMRWSLVPDEALVLEMDGAAGFWLLTNEGIFGNSMDYRYRPVSYTPSRTAVDADSTIRLVLTHHDPGVANWIDTSGFAEGVLTFRAVLSTTVPTFRTTVVPANRARDLLPPGTALTDPATRAQQMIERSRAVQRRFG